MNIIAYDRLSGATARHCEGMHPNWYAPIGGAMPSIIRNANASPNWPGSAYCLARRNGVAR